MGIGNIYRFRHALWESALKQLKVKYANSVLGIWLAVINPLLIMIGITFVFQVVLKLKIENFSFFLLAGILPWLFFSNTLFEATAAIINQRNLLHQFNFPKEIIPLSVVLANFLNFCLGWCVIYPLFLCLNCKIIFLFPLFLWLLLISLVFIAGLSLFLSVTNVFYRDVGQLLGVLMMFWFWITPVFYSVEMVPKAWQWVYRLNPMTVFIEFYRKVIFQGSFPGSGVLIGTLLWSSFSFCWGYLIFKRLESEILKRV